MRVFFFFYRLVFYLPGVTIIIIIFVLRVIIITVIITVRMTAKGQLPAMGEKHNSKNLTKPPHNKMYKCHTVLKQGD